MYKRTCIKESEQSKCVGSFEKFVPCKKENVKPVTYSTEANINGKVRVVDMQLDGEELPNTELKKKLQTERDLTKLKQIAKITIEKLFYARDFDIVKVEIISLKIGSLIIEYVVTIDTKTVENKTVSGFNPVEKETIVFEDVSHYKGKILPAYSFITGKLGGYDDQLTIRLKTEIYLFIFEYLPRLVISILTNWYQ